MLTSSHLSRSGASLKIANTKWTVFPVLNAAARFLNQWIAPGSSKLDRSSVQLGCLSQEGLVIGDLKVSPGNSIGSCRNSTWSAVKGLSRGGVKFGKQCTHISNMVEAAWKRWHYSVYYFDTTGVNVRGAPRERRCVRAAFITWWPETCTSMNQSLTCLREVR